VPRLPNLDHLSHAEKDALIRALRAQAQGLTARVAALEARLGEPSKIPDNSSLPPSNGQVSNQPGDVGEAIAAYLHSSHPATAHGRTIFLRIKAPHRPLSPCGVTG
jgi:hypothetical protein